MSELKRGLRSMGSETSDGQANGQDPKSTQNDDGDLDTAAIRKQKRRQRRDRRRKLTLSVLPTLLTLGNGVCGLAAIAVAMSVNLEWTLETKMMVAGLLIFGGMLFDALDGSAARMTGQESEFGAQLDSLCDAITFGTAPAVLVWRFNSGGFLPLKLTWAIGVLFALCVLIRLARFNVETDEDDTHEGFEGLPSPAAAGTIAAFAVAMYELASYIPAPTATTSQTAQSLAIESSEVPATVISSGTVPINALPAGAASTGDAASAVAANIDPAALADQTSQVASGNWLSVAWLAEQSLNAFHYLIPALALALAFLMVSRFQYPHIFQQLIRGRRAPHQIGQALFVVIGAFLFHALVLPIAFCYYAFRAPIHALIIRSRKTASPTATD